MAEKRKIVVTSALPYANGDIHLGHLVEYLQTDFWVRFQKMRGHECIYVCADDTHGTPIMIRARKEGKEDGVRSAHILLRTIPTAADSARVLQRADSLRASIKTKADFAAAAKKFSEDKSSNFAGGLLGWFQKNEMVPAYVDPVANLNVGEVSEPVEIDGSYHLFRLDDSRQIRELTLEEDYGKIEAMAANHLENEKLNALLKKWREEVHIEIRMTE